MFDFLNSSFNRFKMITLIEGISFIVLIFIAMPIKYMLGEPSVVRTVGSIHGGLFVLYILYLVICHFEYNWNFKKSAILFLMSFIPFGNFYADKKYLQTENQ